MIDRKKSGLTVKIQSFKSKYLNTLDKKEGQAFLIIF